MKKTTLIALCTVGYDGRLYGQNAQFDATEEDAARLVKSKQAAEAPPKKIAAEANAAIAEITATEAHLSSKPRR